MNYKKVLERISLLMSEANPSTKRQYLTHITNFLEFINYKDSPDKIDIIRYRERLRKKRKAKDSYLDFIERRCLKKLWVDGLEKPWPLGKYEGPRPKEEEMNVPILHPDDIKKMIVGVKEWGSQQEKVTLILSTIWGVRRCEIRKVRKEDVDLKETTIRIRTAKGGRTRKHLIPKEVQTYLLSYDFPEISDTALSLIFNKLCKLSDINKPEGAGYHSIRRTLDIYFSDKGLHPAVINKFLRWKEARAMQMRYYHKEDIEVDKIVYGIHPFLPAWGVNYG